MKIVKKCIIIFVFSFIADILAAIHIRTLVSNQIVISITTAFFLQYINFCYNVFFIDEISNWRRLLFTSVNAIGIALGTFVTIRYF